MLFIFFILEIEKIGIASQRLSGCLVNQFNNLI